MKFNKKKIKEDIKEINKEDDEGFEIIDTEESKTKLTNIKRISFYRGLCVCEALVIVILLLFNFFLFLIPKKEITAIVEVNPLTGTQITRNMEGAIQELDKYTAPEYLILNACKTYITNLRSVSTDVYQSRENVKNVYAFSTENAIRQVESYLTLNNPIERYNKNKERVAIYIYNATPIQTVSKKGETKVQIDWQETSYDQTNIIRSQKTYRAILDVKQFKATKQTSQINPIGIYVTNIIVSEIEDGFIKQEGK